jgi:rod shape-determining protein MreC
MLTGYFGESTGGPLHRFQSGVQTILSPIEAGASRAFKPIRDLGGWFGDVFDSKGQNKKLKKDLATTRTQLAQAQSNQLAYEQLRKLVNLDNSADFPQTKRVTGRVIWQSPTAWYSTIEIDVGRGDGVKVNQPVVNGDGLIGTVSQVTGGTAVVTLITDSDASVAAEVGSDGARGIVQPSVGDPSKMQLKFIQKGHPVVKGAQIMTSGISSGRLSSIYPRGIPIGRVTKVSSDDLELYRQVDIEPFADFRRIDYVQVLTSKAKQPVSATGTGGP